MIKRLVMVVFCVGAIICISAPVYSQDNSAESSDTSVSMPVAADEETLPVEEGAGEGVITGDVTALDTTTGSITIKGADGVEKAFNVVDGETILWKGIEDIKLPDIKNGDKAEVGYYTDDTGKLVASWVDVIVPEQPSATGAPSAPEGSMHDEE